MADEDVQLFDAGEPRARVLAYTHMADEALRAIRSTVGTVGPRAADIRPDVNQCLVVLNRIRYAAEQLRGGPDERAVYSRIVRWARANDGEALWRELPTGHWDATVRLGNGLSWSVIDPDCRRAVARLLDVLHEVPWAEHPDGDES